MSETLTKKQAVEYLGLENKTFDNYFKNAEEFSCLPRNGGRYNFDKTTLERWLDSYRWRMIELTIEEYLKCLDFSLAMHFSGYVLSDWSTGRQREFGQKISNWVRGQLGEIAVQKFFSRDFHIDVELDFEIHDHIVPQDIIKIGDGGHMRDPRIKVGIKSSKPKNSFLVLSPNEIERPERVSDAYIFCRPTLPDDHLLRITNERITSIMARMPHFSRYAREITALGNINCEIAGWCWREDLEVKTSIPGQSFDGSRYVKASGLLYKNRGKWQELINEL